MLENSTVNTTANERVDQKITGMKLYSIYNTKGLFKLLDGGVGYDYVSMLFTGNGTDNSYEFRLELYNNSSSVRSLSGLSLVLSILTAVASRLFK